ncbi:MAG: NAD(P)/FAD-dependent oxidoreductase [Pseudomonadota bacterium]
MTAKHVDTVVVGAGQAGIAMSEHLSQHGIDHVVLEKSRIAEAWRTARWDSLVANGPAWHDRFPNMEFKDHGPDQFPDKEAVAEYMEDYARQVNAPIHCGVEVRKVIKNDGGSGFCVETSHGDYIAHHVVAATGPFQKPVFPPIIPAETDVVQMHSARYRNPAQLPDGAIMVVGAGSSGSQIAEELMNAGREVYLSVGAHDRPPRSYRGRDFVWWLGVLGKWDMVTPGPGTEHVTIAVSGADGGRTVDFRRFAQSGITLVGLTESCSDGKLRFASDVCQNVNAGDANYLALLDEADAYVARNGLDLPEDPEARKAWPEPDCLTNPLRELDLREAGVSTVIWATGYSTDYSWLQVDALDEHGRPAHQRGISTEPGVYFLGLPWQSRRGSSFIWGVWHDAKFVADQIAIRRMYFDYQSEEEAAEDELMVANAGRAG